MLNIFVLFLTSKLFISYNMLSWHYWLENSLYINEVMWKKIPSWIVFHRQLWTIRTDSIFQALQLADVFPQMSSFNCICSASVTLTISSIMHAMFNVCNVSTVVVLWQWSSVHDHPVHGIYCTVFCFQCLSGYQQRATGKSFGFSTECRAAQMITIQLEQQFFSRKTK